jgi:hypothetical protein
LLWRLIRRFNYDFSAIPTVESPSSSIPRFHSPSDAFHIIEGWQAGILKSRTGVNGELDRPLLSEIAVLALLVVHAANDLRT